ncbi:hypothetical protein SAMN05444397_104325 [Flavobacterium aquidurense]|uniref:Uncharacterized protein n=1 Tax=Flavobacterium frigidimaris TaxID=262320 RepID=A0ABX4BLJ8_FLAFR|nr:hypothetical protein [Flavobacterium frigidimaris]OXA77052.1 hypothetical protein B0A65_17245 [Flavobacterium frigidimaris]SDZ24699.1 hypothetical protein SAMN05444397_104325 [Flavobacterium aquidurense]
METTNVEFQDVSSHHYNFAANMLLNENKSAYETKNQLVEQGLSTDIAGLIVENVEIEIQEAKHEKARKDMIYGALWFCGGTILTLADIGFIFWGAILFGGIQFFKGLINSNS